MSTTDNYQLPSTAVRFRLHMKHISACIVNMGGSVCHKYWTH